MATQAQIIANRANAQKRVPPGCGPKTPEGKAKSCLNHVSHGFSSANLFIVMEDQEEFNGLLSDLTNEFQPATPHEQILVEKMVHHQWLSLRAIRLQSGGLMVTVPQGHIHKDLGLLIRYQTTADRAYHKAHDELLKAQKEREKSEIGFESKKVAEPAERPVESPQEPPAVTEKITEKTAPVATPNPDVPDFTPFEHVLAAEPGMGIQDLMRAA